MANIRSLSLKGRYYLVHPEILFGPPLNAHELHLTSIYPNSVSYSASRGPSYLFSITVALL
jgi:hypothetical protein